MVTFSYHGDNIHAILAAFKNEFRLLDVGADESLIPGAEFKIAATAVFKGDQQLGRQELQGPPPVLLNFGRFAAAVTGAVR